VARVNLILLAVLIACALSLVTSRHDARRLFVELEREQLRTRQLETEYGQLAALPELFARLQPTFARIKQLAHNKNEVTVMVRR